MNADSQTIIDLATQLDHNLADRDATIQDLVGKNQILDQQIGLANQNIQSLVDQNKALVIAGRKVTIIGIQAMVPESLWYEARSAGAPKTGPHGTINIRPGSPATADFHPIILPGNSSDNVYNLVRLYPKLTADQKASLETAAKLTIGCDVSLDPLSSVQAFELDYQIRKSSGVVINVGLQILPSSPTWQVRLFDFVNKDWVPVGAKVQPQAGLLVHVEVAAHCDDKVVSFDSVTTGNSTVPVTYSHPTSISKDSTGAVVVNQPYINAAYQLDATGDAKPYRATVDKLTVTFN